jgi:hypothetical protein
VSAIEGACPQSQLPGTDQSPGTDDVHVAALSSAANEKTKTNNNLTTTATNRSPSYVCLAIAEIFVRTYTYDSSKAGDCSSPLSVLRTIGGTTQVRLKELVLKKSRILTHQ